MPTYNVSLSLTRPPNLGDAELVELGQPVAERLEVGVGATGGRQDAEARDARLLRLGHERCGHPPKTHPLSRRSVPDHVPDV
jgi:hypothetical protein